MATLRVTPDEYGAIRKHANDYTETEFIGWMLEKWPHLVDHLREEIEVVVDWGSGDEPTGEAIQPYYILSIRTIR